MLTRIRWRAAHCVRRLVRYGDNTLLKSLSDLWERTIERSFRAPGTPFYWQAARLWLVTTVSRVAFEKSSAVAPIAGFLLNTLRDNSYPHPAVKSFAKDTLQTLVERDSIRLTEEEQIVLEKVNRPSMHRLQRDRGRGADTHRGETSRRWEFDWMDTMPYWIQPTSNVFANVSSQQLADEAERWIVDRWKIEPKYCKWNNDPRQSRYSERDYDLRSHRHGSAPVVEDYHTYLSWYAIQCAVGSLSETEPLSKTEYDDGVDEFEERLERQKLSEPPFWLADLLSVRPSEPEFWSKPGDIDSWLTDVSEEAFLEHLMRGTSGEEFIVTGGARLRCSEFRWDVTIRSALVAPSNAPSLVRALQTIEEPLDFALPDAGPDRYGNKLSLDDGDFKLVGWVRMHDSERRFDDHDPMHFDTSRTIASPFQDSPLPSLAEDGVLHWPAINGINFAYERWKDGRDQRDREYEGGNPQSSGWRLFARAEEIRSFLKENGRDMILEIDLKRERGGHSYQRRKEEESKRIFEGRFCGIFLFRHDGTIHTAQGCLGTWPIPRVRASGESKH
jgi:hypothetical protein